MGKMYEIMTGCGRKVYFVTKLSAWSIMFVVKFVVKFVVVMRPKRPPSHPQELEQGGHRPLKLYYIFSKVYHIFKCDHLSYKIVLIHN